MNAVRQEAIARLLGNAAKYGDRGDSTKTIEDLLNGVDMDVASRAQAGWDARAGLLSSSGDTLVQQTADAYKALRDKNAALRNTGGGGGSSRRSSSPAPALTAYTPTDNNWLDEWRARFGAPGGAPQWQAPAARQTPAGYGASQHPVQYRPPRPVAPPRMRLS